MADRLHPAVPRLAAECRAGLLSRREFLARATALGGVAAGACLGLAPGPTAAQDTAAAGDGTLRVQMEVRPLSDPRLWDWPQIANLARGMLEYLVEYDLDTGFRPMLLEDWRVSDDATVYELTLREGITWSTGEVLTAEHVAWNIRRWCEAAVPGNSMATRMGGLVDPATGVARAGAIEVTGPRTLRLNLPQPDITLVASMADYPAAILHPGHGDGQLGPDTPGTGPYRLAEHVPGERAVLVRRDAPWWGTPVLGGPTLDRIEFLDFGTDPASWVRALRDGAVDMLYESVGDFVGILDELGFPRHEVETANTLVIRCNQTAEVEGVRPYADPRVRQAIQLACANDIILELGYGGRGTVAENHHVAPVQPDYAPLGPQAVDPAAARALMAEAGLDGVTHELVSIDDDWRRASADAAAALLTDAGIPVRRRILPGAEFWANWASYPFSATDWNHRPLGVQVLTLAYRSGAAWNETGYANPAFDAALDRALALADAEDRRVVMEELEATLRADAVIVQPYWRRIVRHTRAGVTGAEMHPSFELRPYRLGLSG